ncbi:hypothetical protein SAMN04488543_1908 [Friedmanniella luteola]|uniref:Uncharacterized protein n=2 Tax=Friedmanniella luteola TaxID=546871 RepID=A0A1H1SZC4_9ACTN|nr:hypothetical protein SAMN04488543_1908 [Friedmanniella luteola]
MIPQKLRCLFRKHRWHNGWDEEARETVWNGKRCGLIKSEVDRMPDSWGAGGGASL